MKTFKTMRSMATCLVGAAMAATLCRGEETDVTTVTLTGDDQNAAVTSWNGAGKWSDGAAPSAGKTYVVPNGRMLRTPNLSEAGTFAGDALVLQNGARVNLKQSNGGTASANWVAYGCQIANGNGGNTLGVGGTVEVRGTADAPTVFSGSGVNGSREIRVSAALSGASDAVVKVARTYTGSYENTDGNGSNFTCSFTGTNTAYNGRFTTSITGGDINTPWVIGFETQEALGAPLADAAKVTLADGFVLRGGAVAFTNGYTIALEGNATIRGGTKSADFCEGRYTRAGLEKIYFGRGGAVTGTGSSVLTLEADRFVLADVAFGGIAKIVATGGSLRVHPDYNQPEQAIEARSAGWLVDGSLHVGPVTLKADAALQPGVGTSVPQCLGTFGLASLTMEAGSTLRMSVVKVDGVYTSDFVRVTGNLVKPATGAIPVLFDVFPMGAPAGTKVPLLSAANLGTDVTAADFAFSHTDAATTDLLAGTFTVEEVEGVPTLFFTKTSGIAVYLTGTDGPADGANSWVKGVNWSDKLAPSADKDYVIPSGTLLRRSYWGDAATFAGRSLSIATGGDFAINGLTAIVNDLRLYDGGTLSTRNDDANNRLQGTATCYGTLYGSPFDFKIEAPNYNPQLPNDSQTRTLNLEAKLKGSGAIRFLYYDQYKLDANGNRTYDANGKVILDDETVVANRGTPVTFYLVTGDNREFTGRIMITHSSVCADFKDESAMGGPAATFIPDRLHIARGATLRASRSYAICDPTRGVSFGGGPAKDDGGRIEVVAGATLTISNRITGMTTLRKRGAGALALCCDTNVFSGNVRGEQGTLVIGAAGAVAQATNLVCEAGATWRIDAPEGMTVKNLDAIGANAEGTRALTVAPAAFATPAAQEGKIVANLLRIRNTEATAENVATALSRVTLDASALGTGWKTRIATEAAAGDLLLTAIATRDGFTFFLR